MMYRLFPHMTRNVGPSIRICQINIKGISGAKYQYLHKVLADKAIDIVVIHETRIDINNCIHYTTFIIHPMSDDSHISSILLLIRVSIWQTLTTTKHSGDTGDGEMLVQWTEENKYFFLISNIIELSLLSAPPGLR